MNNPRHSNSATEPPHHGGKYLTVVLETEAYGIAVLKVREIIRQQKIAPIPQQPNFIRGVINLRGRVIPIIDLRLRFGLGAKLTERTCIVVVDVALGDEQKSPMGLIVDSVEEVVALADTDIEPTPSFGSRVDTDYLLGLAKVSGSVKMLLDIDRVVAADVAAALDRAAA